jgi:hypothetical protein
MQFLRDLAALDKAHHEDLFPSLFVERNRASLNNLPQIDELLDIDNTNAVEDQHTSALTWRPHQVKCSRSTVSRRRASDLERLP